MNPEMVLRAYEQLSAAPLSSIPDFSSQSVVVHDDNGYRLVLTRIDEAVHLDVEISRPELEITSGFGINATTEECLNAAIRSIKLLEFLVNLVDHGFSLLLVDSEFLWIASIILTEPPPESLLELLQSPIEMQ